MTECCCEVLSAAFVSWGVFFGFELGTFRIIFFMTSRNPECDWFFSQQSAPLQSGSYHCKERRRRKKHDRLSFNRVLVVEAQSCAFRLLEGRWKDRSGGKVDISSGWLTDPLKKI